MQSRFVTAGGRAELPIILNHKQRYGFNTFRGAAQSTLGGEGGLAVLRRSSPN